MNKKSIVSVIFAVIFTSLPAFCEANPSLLSSLALSTSVSSLGLGASLTYNYSKFFSLTFGAKSITLGDMPDNESTGIDYNIKAELRTFPLLLNFHPFAGSLHLSSGVVWNDSRLSLVTDLSDKTVIALGSAVYTGPQVGVITGAAGYHNLAYYAGVGSGYGAHDVIGLTIDAGLLYMGQPNFSLYGSGNGQDLALNLEKEKKHLEENSVTEVYPVLSLGFFLRLGWFG